MNIKTFTIHSARNIFAFFIALGLGYVAYTVNPTTVAPTKVEAGASQNVTGWAWSENVGWTSFNSFDCDSDKNGFTDSGACSGDNTTTTAFDYGVNISPLTGTGIFSGYAWSENVGWVSFNRTDTGNPPSAPFNGGSGPIAQVDWSTGNVTGWARVLSQTGDGWIKLSDDSIGVWNGKGVKIDTTTGKFSGYAWSSDSVGWISFNCITDGSCGSSNYFVQGPIPVTTCTDNSTCIPSGQLCNITTGSCVIPSQTCGPSSSCGIGQLCNGSNLCVYLGGACSTSANCVGGQICLSGSCMNPGSCNSNADCTVSGQICNTTTHSCYDKPKTKFWQF